MSKNLRCRAVKIIAYGCTASIRGCPCFPAPPAPEPCCKGLNLVQNPSFEAGLTGWTANNAALTNVPFEGTQEALLGPNVASIFQDFPLDRRCRDPLFLSFNVFAPSSNNGGSLIAEVSWLDSKRRAIASGLRLFIPENRINTTSRITYFAVTGRPPAGTAGARLQFSKGSGTATDLIKLDQVILAPIRTPNLVQNSGFELGLARWTATAFIPDFSVPYAGSAQLHATDNGTLFQDIPLKNLPAQSPLLISFAASGGQTSLSVQLLWLNRAGDPIGTPGISLFIPGETFVAQGNNYLTYLALTEPAPAGAAAARILLVDTIDKQTDIFVDQVIVAGARSANLVRNGSFENGLSDWTAVNVSAVLSESAYEGSAVARVGTEGGLLFQEVPLPSAAGHSFLFNFGFRSSSIGVDLPGTTIAEVRWLDGMGREIGLGLSLVVPNTSLRSQWLVYTGITAPAPPGVAAARVQFTRSTGSPEVVVELDKVVLGRLV